MSRQCPWRLNRNRQQGMSPDPQVPHSRISIASWEGILADLVILSKATGQPANIVAIAEPLLLSVTVTFTGSGAIALMPLAPAIQVDFCARALPRRDTLELGTVTLPTQPQQFTYTPAIALPNGLAAAGAMPDHAYWLSALVRVGAVGYPAFMTGWIEGSLFQTYDG